ncbi:SusC/RagA family TonB-linked outer membrane protein [Hymenobacter wooponensis]|uniref:TonB-dependent receptor n=1 Tax=Hymenobacter wooponensis TaxID=1525360 RepID=A0A4Z0MJN4_9BACT|nr:TonB-dependent receptor [Hymenobacter wooponensis]TGD79498.1 TonB-dependent receptor [Hymenobacter wooponensis]
MQFPLRKTALGLSWPLLAATGLSLAGGLLAPTAVQAQATAQSVSGRVVGTDGAGLPGVNVVVKGSTTGTVTDGEGRFTVAAPAGSTLVFSFVGFTSKEVAVGNQSTVNVTLGEDAKALSEVVVVGYGVQKKSQVTGAISSVDEQSLRDVPVANIGQALQGRAAGVNISSASSSPGQNPVIRIRGNRSFAGSNDPLLVVDGVPYDGNLNDLNPDDITSLEVLKDASSTAIYGARGANGVILITTKRGKAGAPRATYSAYYGTKKPYGLFDLQNGQEYYNFRFQAYQANGIANPLNTPGFLTEDEKANYAAGRTTDYQDLLFQNGRIQNHSLGLSGGTEETQYSASLGYYDETGIVPVQGIKRYSLRGTLDQKIGKRVKIGLNTLNSFTQQNDPGLNIINGILTGSPLASPYDANGIPVLFPNTDTALGNPLNFYTEDAHLDQRRRIRTFNSIYGQVNILKGLDYRLNIGLDGRSETSDSFFASNTPARGGGQNAASRSQNLAFNLLAENILTYNRTFGRHDVNFTGLYSAQEFRTDGFNAGSQNLPTNYQQSFNLGAGTPTAPGSFKSQFDIISYMGRANYAFDNRYSATVTVRVDGSSRLAPGNKYKAFPSAAVAWNIANEQFLQGQAWVSSLKLRASYGRVGSTAVSTYQTLGSLQSALGNGYYNFGSTGAIGVVPATIPNPNLGWEYTATTNFGLDFGLFNNRVSGSVEVYQQRTSDLLLPDALPTASGYSAFTRNVGQTQNRGLEIGLTTVNVRSESGFEWSTDWNFTVNREKVLNLGLGKDENGKERSDLGNQRFIGQPLYVFYDYKKVGIWQTNEAAEAAKYNSKVGQIKIQDANGNGTIDPGDRQIVGTRQPKFEAGMTQRFRYKGFDLTAVGLTRVGATVIDPLLFGPSYFTTFEGRRNQVNLDYWTPQNPTNAFPQPRQGNGDFPPYSTTLAYQSGTFIKVRSIDLGYSLPAAIAKKALISTARVYVQVQNPLIWSPVGFYKKNKAIDPDALSYSTRFGGSGQPGGVAFAEGDLNGNVNSTLAGRGVNYPATRAFIVGLNLGF